MQKGSINEIGLFIQDSWRVRPNLTINAGVRWELQRPFKPGADNYTTAEYADVFGVSGLDANGNPNLFKPGVMTGRPTEFIQYGKGTRAYRIEYGNFAPTLGGAWTPSAQQGFLRRLLGREGDSVIRGGYSKAFNRNGMSDYSGIFGANPGSQLTATRSNALGNLNDGQGLPVLFRDVSRLGPPAFATTPDYPLTVAKGTAQVTNSVNVFDPNMQTPYAHSWTIGWQRALTRDMVVEARYVGTRGRKPWQTVDYNEVNIIENGFLDECRRAQSNLMINIANGRGNTFAYTGLPGTSPLPIYLAYLNGIGAADAGDPSRYTGGSWSSTNFTNALARFDPDPYAPASDSANNGLFGNPERRANATRAGVPENFFLVNPGLLGGCQRPDQPRVLSLRRTADRSAPAAVAGAAGPGQLRLRRHVCVEFLLHPQADPGVDRHGIAGQRSPRVQGGLGLRVAVRARPSFREQRQCAGRRIRGRVVVRWHGPNPERPGRGLRKRPPGRHDGG